MRPLKSPYRKGKERLEHDDTGPTMTANFFFLSALSIFPPHDMTPRNP